jgi:crotonobetainyl-CoA:carnitine CoA-transferase CaiB-like acyl-CoA transferase
MLGDLGANVVKVEPPGGESSRGDMDGAYFTSYNTSKRSISVDLKDERSRNVLRRGVEQADVIIENFRPGVMAKFDLDYETVSSYNERIIYCSISGYGQTGPYREYPAYDPIIQARSGMMETTGYPDLPPVRFGMPVIDMGTASYAAFAVLAALWNREQTGQGEFIDLSLFDTAVSWMSSYITYYHDTGEIPRRKGRKGGDDFAPTAVCQVSDGDVYLLAPTQKMFRQLCETIDREDMLQDDRFESREARSNHHDELIEELEATFEEHTVNELVKVLSEGGIPVGPVRDIGTVVDEDPHAKERDLFHKTTNRSQDTETLVSRLPFRFDNMETQTEDPPVLGGDSERVLAEWGVDRATISELVDDGVLYTE